MINVSTEFKELMQSRTDFRCNADITFADGDTLILGSSAFTLSNNSITDAAALSSFPLGVALSRSIQLELLNDNDQYITYDFFGAKIRLYLTFALSATVEKIEMGTFTVLEPETYGETVIITARDDMYKADTAYITRLTYPATLAAMFREICDNCDLPYSTSNFANSSFAVQNAPTGNITHRQVLGYIAMIAGGNARVNREGDVEILSYNFGSLNAPLHTLKNWKNLKVDTSNIMITGLQTTVAAEEYGGEDTVYTFGDEGYMLSVDNPLIAGQEANALQLMATSIVGVPFRKFSGDHIAYPLIEFMDTVEITDRKGKVYKSFVTDVNFVFFGITTLSNSAESALRNNSLYVSPETKAIIAAQKLVEKERTARETAFEQLNQKLEQAGGFFSTDVTQPDGSVIRYMHDKPTLEASSNVIKITAEAIGFSTDGGDTYPFGVEVSGDVIAKILSTEGINADWINTGVIIAKNAEGDVVFAVNVVTGEVTINGTNGNVEFRNCPFRTSHSKTYYASDYTQDDLTRLQQIMIGNITPTDDDYERYDINGDGVFSATDFVIIRNMNLGRYEWVRVTWYVEIEPSDKQKVLRTYYTLEDSSQGLTKTAETFAVGAGGVTKIIVPTDSMSGLLAFDSQGNVYGTNTIPFEMDILTNSMYRTLGDGSVEWLNPPMEVGVEYRTTERHNGKTVYTALLDIGALPNASTKTATLSGKFASSVVRYNVVVRDASGNERNAEQLSGISDVCVRADGSQSLYIRIVTTANLSTQTAKAQVWYTY